MCNETTSVALNCMFPCLQPQGTIDHFISDLISDDIDLDGSCNGTVSGSATYYSPVIHTTTIGPLSPGVTYYYRVSSPFLASLGWNLDVIGILWYVRHSEADRLIAVNVDVQLPYDLSHQECLLVCQSCCAVMVSSESGNPKATRLPGLMQADYMPQ